MGYRVRIYEILGYLGVRRCGVAGVGHKAPCQVAKRSSYGVSYLRMIWYRLHPNPFLIDIGTITARVRHYQKENKYNM